MLEDLKRLDAYIPVATSTESLITMTVSKEGSEARLINSRFDHGAQGLVTEVGEIQEALDEYIESGEYDYVNLIEEAGDVIWYLAIVVDSLGLKFEDLFEEDWSEIHGYSKGRANLNMIKTAAQILNKNKRTVFYGKPLEVDDLDIYLKDIIKNLYYFCEDVKSDLVNGHKNAKVVLENDGRTGIEIAIDKVTRKLTGDKGRYKDGFSEEEAYNRDLDQEREVLES